MEDLPNREIPSHHPEPVPLEPVTPSPGFSPPVEKIKQNRKPLNLERATQSVRFWVVTPIIIFLAIVLVKLIVQEVSDRSYHIQAFRVPEEFAKDGYDGVTAAYILLDKVNEMIKFGNHARSLKDVEEYNQSDEHNDLQVEVSGIGISPEAIASVFRKALGINTRSIGGQIVKKDKTLKLFLRITGAPPEMLTQSIDTAGVHVALENLLQQAAESVLKHNNPLLLGLFYSRIHSYKATETFRYAIQRQPNNAASVYAWWAEFLYESAPDGDTTSAMPKIRKALEIDPNNATAYNIWGCMTNHVTFEDQERLMRKSLSLDPTWVAGWNDLGTLLAEKPERENEAIECFRKCYEMDSTYATSLVHWTALLFRQGKFEAANEMLEKLLYINPGHYLMPMGIAVALNDTAQAMRIYKSRPADISNEDVVSIFNNYAFEQEKRKNYSVGFRLVRFGLQMDSTSRGAAFAYSTLAELYGLTGNKEAFYKNIERAVSLGYSLGNSEIILNEPYKVYSKEDRFKKLFAKLKRDSN